MGYVLWVFVASHQSRDCRINIKHLHGGREI
jgi:hypothetical protein